MNNYFIQISSYKEWKRKLDKIRKSEKKKKIWKIIINIVGLIIIVVGYILIVFLFNIYK